MTEMLSLTHERVDDIPVIIGMGQQLHLPELLDRHLGNHGLHQGLSNGTLTMGWLAYIISEGDHRKSTVEGWAESRRQTLERLLGEPIRPVEFNDDRLGIVLHRLSKDEAWEALEAELWASTVAVYDPGLTGVRLDSTTSCGYHTVREGGLMQFSRHSKDHRPDLPQLKLMAAGAEGSGQLIACDVLPGQRADDALYQPLIARVRQVVGRSGLLYAGDCKMASLATRADIVAHGDYYLMPLPLTGKTQTEFESWVEAAVEGEQPSCLLWDERRDEEREGARLLGAGYEFERPLSAEVDGRPVEWRERVQVIRSLQLARQQAAGLEERLGKAEAALRALTPLPGPGKHQYRDEESVRAAIAEAEARYRVGGLLQVSLGQEEQSTTHYVGRGRGGPDRPTVTEVRVRYAITEVWRDEEAIMRARDRLGWRVQATNVPMAARAAEELGADGESQHGAEGTNVLKVGMSLAEAVTHYRGGWSLERDFHLVKDRPLGISPLYVRNDDQIPGLTRLLSLGVRLLTLIETQVRRGLAQGKESLVGLYEGQAKKATDTPTATRLLQAFARAEITLTRAELGGQSLWHVTPLTGLLQRILDHLGLSKSLYERLAENSS